jgi:hypothetical protein
MTDAELQSALRRMSDLLNSVATGGPRIGEVNDEYRELREAVRTELEQRGVELKIPFQDLWEWYGRYSGGDFPTWRSRRMFIAELMSAQQNALTKPPASVRFEATGWERVDRTIGEIRRRLADAANEEQYQAVGMLCREALISLAQEVYEADRHPSEDQVTPSSTDFKRMLGAYIEVELGGGSNKIVRTHTRAAFDLANVLQHSRTANFRAAALCVEATAGVVNVIAIVSGRRDP